MSIDGSFLFIFFAILCLIFILNRTLFKPINKVLDEREHLGAGRLEEAKRVLAQYEVRLTKYEEQIGQARAEAYQQMEAKRRESQAARAKMLTAIKAETAAQIDGAKQEIAKQTTAARQNLENEALGMARTISSQLLGRPVSEGGIRTR